MLCSRCSRNLRLWSFDPTKVAVTEEEGSSRRLSALPILHNCGGESEWMSGWDTGLDRFDRFHAIYPHDRYNLSASGGVLASFNVSRADEIVPPPGTLSLVRCQQEHRQTDDTKVIKRTGEEATRRCHFADRARRMTILFSWKRIEILIIRRHHSGRRHPSAFLFPPSIREIIDTRVMLLWLTAIALCRRGRSNRLPRPSFVTIISFSYSTTDIFRRYLIENSSLVCAEQDREGDTARESIVISFSNSDQRYTR